MKRTVCVAAIVALTCAMAGPSSAQTPSPSWFERAFGVNLKTALCGVAPLIIRAVAGEAPAAMANTIARNIGICPQASSTIPPLVVGDPAASAVLPGLQVRVVAVKGTVDAPIIEAGTPQTIYAQGDGFALVVASNAPGYLEVWSVDATTETFVEGIILNPDRASLVALPVVVEGAYRFDTAGGRDSVRLKFLPCRAASPQSFRPVANARVAQAVSVSPAVRSMTQTLPTCPFSATVSRTTAQSALFTTPTAVSPVFAEQSNTYTAVLPATAGAPALRSLTSDIEFRRQ